MSGYRNRPGLGFHILPTSLRIWSWMFLCSLVFGVWSFSISLAAETSSPRQRISFNSDWLFIKGDPAGSSANLDYQTLKPWLITIGSDFSTNSPPQKPNGNPGPDVPYAQASFDDSQWRKLSLPHDWGIEGPFKQEYPGETGKLPWWGIGWYRKYFTLPDTDKGKQIFLDVDGAMAYAAVWLNGQFVGGWQSLSHRLPNSTNQGLLFWLKLIDKTLELLFCVRRCLSCGFPGCRHKCQHSSRAVSRQTRPRNPAVFERPL